MTGSATVSNRTIWPDARAKYERATHVLPGGNSRTQLYLDPHPLYVETGQGARITLSDGVELNDFLLNYTAAAVGYAHPLVVEAARAALGIGAPFGMPTRYEIEFAEILQARVPTLERMRFTNSGSEATLHAIRAARAYSGRSTIAKAEGAYHGSHDLADFSVWTLAETPLQVVPQTKGIPSGLSESVVLFPYNDVAGTLSVLELHRDELATVIVEPFLNAAGVIRAERDYLAAIAEWCVHNKVLLTVDEVASFRVSYSGAHSDYDIKPDLICLGKALGGGFAVGAFGGREEVMSICDPRNPGHIKHAGTFNGHPVTLAAGAKVLEILDRDTIARMNEFGERIVAAVREIGMRRGLALTATGYGSVGNLHISRTPPSDARQASMFPKGPIVDLYWALIDQGYVIAPRGQFSICAVTSSAQVDGLIEAIDECAGTVLESSA
jgi:glutamate-1-semialdehyde 2,1-aminomutase